MDFGGVVEPIPTNNHLGLDNGKGALPEFGPHELSPSVSSLFAYNTNVIIQANKDRQTLILNSFCNTGSQEEVIIDSGCSENSLQDGTYIPRCANQSKSEEEISKYQTSVDSISSDTLNCEVGVSAMDSSHDRLSGESGGSFCNGQSNLTMGENRVISGDFAWNACDTTPDGSPEVRDAYVPCSVLTDVFCPVFIDDCDSKIHAEGGEIGLQQGVSSISTLNLQGSLNPCLHSKGSGPGVRHSATSTVSHTGLAGTHSNLEEPMVSLSKSFASTRGLEVGHPRKEAHVSEVSEGMEDHRLVEIPSSEVFAPSKSSALYCTAEETLDGSHDVIVSSSTLSHDFIVSGTTLPQSASFDNAFDFMFSDSSAVDEHYSEFFSSFCSLKDAESIGHACAQVHVDTGETQSDFQSSIDEECYGVSVMYMDGHDTGDVSLDQEEPPPGLSIAEAIAQVDVPEVFRDWLERMVNEHAYTFNVGTQRVGNCTMFTYRLVTNPHHPFTCRPYRLSEAENKVVEEQVKTMLANGAIRPSSSPYRNPIFVLWKKDGTGRFILDARKLNTTLVNDTFPLPYIRDMLDALKGAKWFSHLDLVSGYWQIVLAEDDRSKTAFATRNGLYEFNVLPFGISTAPAAFQRMLQEVLQPVLGKGVLVYIDDIIIYSATVEEHLQLLTVVFSLLEKAGLRVKPSKCAILQKRLQVLGHVVDEFGIHVDPAKVESIRAFPTPTDVKSLQRFLGATNYYHTFLDHYAGVAQPLFRLLTKGVPWVWSDQCEQAFRSLIDK